MVTITDTSNVVAWSSAGIGFKGSRKGTPFAATQAAPTTAGNAASRPATAGLLDVRVKALAPAAELRSARCRRWV